jgi:hypothetical protein
MISTFLTFLEILLLMLKVHFSIDIDSWKMIYDIDR